MTDLNSDFYAWAEQQDNVFISEYWMPDTFVQIARIEKTILSAANGNSEKACEKLFTNKKTFEQIDKDKYRIAEQMSIFDYL